MAFPDKDVHVVSVGHTMAQHEVAVQYYTSLI